MKFDVFSSGVVVLDMVSRERNGGFGILPTLIIFLDM